jgi:hypothetical protein
MPNLPKNKFASSLYGDESNMERSAQAADAASDEEIARCVDLAITDFELRELGPSGLKGYHVALSCMHFPGDEYGIPVIMLNQDIMKISPILIGAVRPTNKTLLDRLALAMRAAIKERGFSAKEPRRA